MKCQPFYFPVTIHCTTPNILPNSEGPDGMFEIGERVELRCRDGYRLTYGHILTTCQNDLSWSPVTGKCNSK